jgi:DNA-directed RNA polymerase specialized sigma24 family protein
MSQSFEELAGSQLDSLYQAALFLTGGDANETERLLVETLTHAFGEFSSHEQAGIEDGTRWLEVRLIQTFIGPDEEEPLPQLPDSTERPELGEMTLPPLESDVLFTAAASIPRLARAALWLVLLRRRSYGDAMEVMAIDSRSLASLLAYRDLLLRETLLRSKKRSLGVERA